MMRDGWKEGSRGEMGCQGCWGMWGNMGGNVFDGEEGGRMDRHGGATGMKKCVVNDWIPA